MTPDEWRKHYDVLGHSAHVNWTEWAKLCSEAFVMVNNIEAAVGGLNDDWHNRSTRPCENCQTITGLTGKPFGCIAYRVAEQNRKRSHD